MSSLIGTCGRTEAPVCFVLALSVTAAHFGQVSTILLLNFDFPGGGLSADEAARRKSKRLLFCAQNSKNLERIYRSLAEILSMCRMVNGPNAP